MTEDNENKPRGISRRDLLVAAGGILVGKTIGGLDRELLESVDDVQVELTPQEQQELRGVMYGEIEDGIQVTFELLEKAWSSEDEGTAKVHYYAALATAKQT